MDSGETQYLFKETRLNLEPPAPASVVTIKVPSTSAQTRAQRKSTSDASGEDEAAFRRKHLASAASIYHRKWHDAPRSFLWRVLEEGTLLSIRAADVSRGSKVEDAALVLNFQFAIPIQPGCIAFADPEEHDELCVFVLDTSSHLYTFTLRPDFFRKRAAVDASLTELAKVQAPAGLGFKYPHRMVAISSNALMVAVSDGGMIRFDRTQPDDASGGFWKESFFNVQGWKQNLRSLLPFHGNHTVKYGRTNMEYSAATSIQISDFGLGNCHFAITVCIDHRIRIWNIQDGQILYTGDLLNAERAPQEIGRWTIDPSQANLIQLTGRSRGQRICATYSPIGPGEFKFWRVVAKDAHTVIVQDMFPKLNLIPETPSSSDIWTLADFALTSPNETSSSLWTLWKNNMTYRVHLLDLDPKNMELSWRDGWNAVHSNTGLITAETSATCDPTDVTEKWLQLILQPGRFTKATLEAALSIYERGLGKSKDSSRGRGLADSICSVLGASATLGRGSSGAMDYEQFRSSSDSQWRRFYRLLIELDKQRGEAIALACDGEADIAWVVCTDIVSAIRECSSLERLCHNLSTPSEEYPQQAALINAALQFVDGFADNYLQMCNAALRLELFEESPKTDLERIQYFSDKAGFWRGITDEDCTQIVDMLGQNFATVTDDLYGQILELLDAPQETKSRSPRDPLTQFGRKLVMSATSEQVELLWKVCFSQVVLLIHMEFEFDHEEDALHNRVDIGQVFRRLVNSLRRLELLKWLSQTEISVPLPKVERNPSSKKPVDDIQIVTALEANVGHLLGFANSKKEYLPRSITDLVCNLCAADSDIEVSPSLIQCSLVKRERADLAFDLAPFCDQSPFAVYVQGRVSLALNDYQSAAIYFKKAAIGMSNTSARLDRHSGGLLHDIEWSLLNNGLAKYYSHIVALFELHRAFTYVIDFCRLSTQFIGNRKDNAPIRAEMFNRLFTAALSTSQFELAHTTLLSIKDYALKQSCLRLLIDRMSDTHHNNELVRLPFPGMQQEVDEFLEKRCKLAKDVIHGSQYHQVLYSWRIKRQNYRGAAWVLLDRIQKLKRAGEGDKVTGDDVLDTPVTRQYLLLINALSCVDAKQAWVFDEGEEVEPGKSGDGHTKRRVVSLADVRKEYQDELDRIAAIQNNQFGFEADDVMDLT